MSLLINNNIAHLSKRHFNEMQKAVCNIQTVKCHVGGSNRSIAWSAGYTWDPSVLVFGGGCCPNHTQGSSGVAGMRKGTANARYAAEGNDGLVINIPAPYTINTLGVCPTCGGTVTDANEAVENQARFDIGACYATGIGTVMYGPPPSPGQSVETYFDSEFKAFSIRELNALPVGSSIVEAKLLLKTTNLVKVTESFTGSVAPGGGSINYTTPVVATNSVDGTVSLLLFAEKADDTLVCLGAAAASVASNNTDDWFEITITDLAQDYQTALATGLYKNFMLCLTPYPATLLDILEDKQVLTAVRAATWAVSFADFVNAGDPCDAYPYITSSECHRLTYDSWAVGEMTLKFALPDLSQYAAPQSGNIPGMA